MRGHTKGWALVCEPLDYLDGIQSGLIVKKDNGAPVAYMFDRKEAQLAAAAPDLLEALDRLYHKTIIGTDEERHDALNNAWSAITRANGGGL